MNKIYHPSKKSKVDWRNDILYPITLFSVACLILLLSSFSTKASIETASSLTIETSSDQADNKLSYTLKEVICNTH